jgi:hypothetical protein
MQWGQDGRKAVWSGRNCESVLNFSFAAYTVPTLSDKHLRSEKEYNKIDVSKLS